mmetsp:Transcript_25331/g.27951  ORF Transcript_25331/g.27951 Transcript_25331/m.27951 type:complete len:95 (-) Transcript_25331:1159-1443(-)
MLGLLDACFIANSEVELEEFSNFGTVLGIFETYFIGIFEGVVDSSSDSENEGVVDGSFDSENEGDEDGDRIVQSISSRKSKLIVGPDEGLDDSF